MQKVLIVGDNIHGPADLLRKRFEEEYEVDFEPVRKHKNRPTNRVNASAEDTRRVEAAKAKRENRRLRKLKVENGYDL